MVVHGAWCWSGVELQVESSTDTDRSSIVLLGNTLGGASTTDYFAPTALGSGPAALAGATSTDVTARRRKPSIEQRRTMAQTMKLGLTTKDGHGKPPFPAETASLAA